MKSSLLGRIARRPLRSTQDTAEDRLTEVFAAVLAHPECAGAAQFVCAGWLRAAQRQLRLSNRPALEELATRLAQGDWETSVLTQFVISVAGRRRRLDLVFGFRGEDGTEIEICVEVKNGAGPEDRQLHDYVHAQQERAIHGAVLLVAPRADYGWFKADEMPDSVPRLTWQQTAVLLGDYHMPRQTGAFLMSELRDYLREEGLMDPERITAEHLVAFAHHKEAFEALEYLPEVAVAYVGEHWAPLSNGSGHRHASWWSFPTAHASGIPVDDRRFDLHMFRDSSWRFRDGRPGVPVFTAGTSGEQGLLADLDRETADRLTDAGFRLYRKDDLLSPNKLDRIWKRAYPDELLTGSSLREQGDGVGRWVVETFEQLYDVLAG